MRAELDAKVGQIRRDMDAFIRSAEAILAQGTSPEEAVAMLGLGFRLLNPTGARNLAATAVVHHAVRNRAARPTAATGAGR
ncbi:hypothetical protein C1I95_25735 [Micromonospora craterilacus]|uniref:Uncharacterized protein n=1 Tax=Micromonospora craterilacus TaxID=1655439 RepID=A0A2W2DP71_9ACTN|nr:hypothetical protein C1I95_25735 [Micromonospora craterilacus]